MLVLLLMAVTGAWAETINLSTLTANTVVPDGATLTGKNKERCISRRVLATRLPL